MGDDEKVDGYLIRLQEYLKDRLVQWRLDHQVRWQSDAGAMKGLPDGQWGRWERGNSFPKNVPTYFDLLMRSDDGEEASPDADARWTARVDKCLEELQSYIRVTVEEYAKRHESSVYTVSVDAPVDSTAIYAYMKGDKTPKFKSYFKLFSFFYPEDERLDGMVFGPLTDIDSLERGVFAERALMYDPSSLPVSTEEACDGDAQTRAHIDEFVTGYHGLKEGVIYFSNATAEERDALRRAITDEKMEMADVFLLARDLMMREEKYQSRPNNLLKHLPLDIGGSKDGKKN